MSQYRNGIINSTTALIASGVNLQLGFVPDKFVVYNWTALATDATAVVESMFIKNVTPAGYASRTSKTITTGALTQANITTLGFTPIAIGGAWLSTQYTITGVTKANPGVVTVTSISPTNTLTLVNGMTVTISNVVGMTQLNTNRYVVANISGSTFQLYDLLGNPVDTTAFGTYVSGGIVNQISYPATAPTIGSNGQILVQGNPPGNQYDTGFYGIALASGVLGANGNVLFWEAWTSTPTGW